MLRRISGRLSGIFERASVDLPEDLPEDPPSENLNDIYGKDFCEAVGVDLISQIPIVPASRVNLENPALYPQQVVLPGHLFPHNVLRGIDGSSRPFIAIRVNLLNEKDEKITEIVELIFKKDGGWSTAWNNKGSDERKYVSMLGSPYLPETSFPKIRQLLKGEILRPLIDTRRISGIHEINFSSSQEVCCIQLAENLDDTYGRDFCKAIGADLISKIPYVPASRVNLEDPALYPQQVVLPRHLFPENALRGIDGRGRPFIAIRVSLLNEKKEKITEVVELILKIVSGWRAAGRNMGEDGRVYDSVFGSWDFDAEELKKASELLKGQIIALNGNRRISAVYTPHISLEEVCHIQLAPKKSQSQ